MDAPLSLNRRPARRRHIVVLAVCAFALLGLAAVQLSQAESFTIAYEAEIGTMEGNARNAALFEADGTTPVTAVAFGGTGDDAGGDPGDDGNSGGDDGGDNGGEPQEGTGPTGSGSIKHISSKRCLDNDGFKTTVGNKIQLYDCFVSKAQNWTFKRIDGKAYSLLQVQGMCIHATGPQDNADVRLADCDSNSDNQQWAWKDSKYIANASNGRCLVPAFGASQNGANVVVANCNDSESQRWDMMDQDDAVPDTPPVPADRTGALRHSSSGRCLDQPYNHYGSTIAIDLWDCNGTEPQRVTVKAIGTTGQFTLQVRGKCVTVLGSMDNARVIADPCNESSTSQQWKKSGSALVSARNGRCLVPLYGGTANGTDIGVSNCNGSASQNWSTP